MPPPYTIQNRGGTRQGGVYTSLASACYHARQMANTNLSGVYYVRSETNTLKTYCGCGRMGCGTCAPSDEALAGETIY